MDFTFLYKKGGQAKKSRSRTLSEISHEFRKLVNPYFLTCILYIVYRKKGSKCRGIYDHKIYLKRIFFKLIFWLCLKSFNQQAKNI